MPHAPVFLSKEVGEDKERSGTGANELDKKIFGLEEKEIFSYNQKVKEILLNMKGGKLCENSYFA